MKQLITLIIVLTLSLNLSYGQEVDEKQVEVGQKFLNFVLKGQNQKSWLLFDKTNVPDLNEEQFDNAVNQMKNDLSVFDTFELTMTGIKLVDNKELNVYSFKAVSKSKNVVDEVMIDLLFFKSSQLVAGIQPKQLLKENSASTTKGKETPIETNFVATIDNVPYNITGINIVHFENNQGLLTIQIECKIPTDLTNSEEWANKDAVKFARYLVKNGYIEKAKLKAKEIDRQLLEDIGVSFLDPSKGGGFNVMVKADEYK